MMTPGFAKPRSELPWLPYPRENEVYVINAHNFETGPVVPGFGDELLLLRGPTGVVDQSGNGNDGVYQGGMGVIANTEQNGVSAFSLDGSNDYIQLPVVHASLPLTLAAWVKVTSQSNFAPVLGIYNSGSGVDWRSIGTRNTANTDYGAISRSASGIVPTSPWVNLSDGTWRLLVGVFRTATDREFFVDGVSVATSSTSSAPTGLDRAAIGYNWDASPSNFLHALVDDVRIFSRALTLTEQQDWYAAGRGYDA